MHATSRRRVRRASNSLLAASSAALFLAGCTIAPEAVDGEASARPSGTPVPATVPAVGTSGTPDGLALSELPPRATACEPAQTTPVPDMVGSIFRCRLGEAGIARAQVQTITAEALVVAQCESEFDANAVVFDGRYRDSPHPTTGSTHSAAGVFQFIRDRADRWVEGGYANVTDPVANIDGAARLYLHNVRRGYPGWSDWACAAANDGFRATSVLPGWTGGPSALPEWAYAH